MGTKKMHIDKDTIAICMATYNGERYLSEQIDSILAQTYSNWILFIRDDNSKDNTSSIIDEYTIKYPEKILKIEDKSLVGGSSKKNFAAIIEWVKYHYAFNYYAFSDQDDYWLPEKVEKTIDVLKKAEGKTIRPVLVHTDLKVADSKLQELGPSFFKYRALNPDVKDLNHLLIQNNITGCTMMWNRSLNDMVTLDDDAVAMHDWWLTLAACCFGTIKCLQEPTILYRQHDNNVVGATKVNTPSFIIKRLFDNNHVKETLKMSVVQAGAFVHHYEKLLDEIQKSLIENYSKLYSMNKMQRIFYVIKNRHLKQGTVQIIGEVIFI